jgi:hypothetical protein
VVEVAGAVVGVVVGATVVAGWVVAAGDVVVVEATVMAAVETVFPEAVSPAHADKTSNPTMTVDTVRVLTAEPATDPCLITTH